MDIEESLQNFWQTFRSSHPERSVLSERHCQAWHFTNHPDAADRLADLVCQGIKQATASLAWVYDFEDEKIPQIGDLSIITLWKGTPVCIIETTAVEVCPFDQVGAEFALAEGEGDRSLTYWRNVHMEVFTEECALIGRTASDKMPVVCEHFRVIYQPGESDS